MPDADSPRPIANMQTIVDRTASAVPTGAFKGSVVNDSTTAWIPLVLIAFAVVVVVVIVVALARE